MNGFIVLIWFISICMVIMWGPLPSTCAFAVALSVLYCYTMRYILYGILFRIGWEANSYVRNLLLGCYLLMVLIVGYDVEFGNYVGSLKNYDRYNGGKRLILDLKGNL